MALYHKYRPQTFAETTGQTHIRKTIQNQLASDTTSHAYLFCGPRGVGKTTTARLIAKAVNCLNRTTGQSEPCNTCASCTEIIEGRSIDVIEIDAASHTGVDHVREHIIENARFQPTSAKMKVFIIDEVHMLSTSAFNALLKTLEEPPAHVMFVLATTELHKLPATIVSRCQRFQFTNIAFEELVGLLESICTQEHKTVAPRVLERIVQKSDGCGRDAISLLDQVLATGLETITEQDVTVVLPASAMQDALACLEHLLVGRSADAIAVFHTILAQGVHPKPFLEDCIELLRAAIILSTKADASATRLDLSKEAMARVQALSEQIPQSHLIASTDEAIKRLGEIRKSPIPAFPVELWITACGIAVHGETMPMPTPTTSPVVQTPPPPQKEHTAPKQAPEVKKETAAPETAMAPSPSKPEPTLEEISKPPATAEAPEPLEAPAVQTPEMSPEVPTNVPVSSEPTTTISLGQANAWWKSALQIIEQHSPSLIFVLNMATVVGCDTEQFTIAVGFSFHKDKIESAECAETIVSALAQVSGARRALAVIIDKTAAAAPASSAPDDIHSLAAAFGGQVVGS